MATPSTVLVRALAATLATFVVALVALGPSPVEAQAVPDDTPLRARWAWPGPVTMCVDASVLPSGVSAGTFRAWVREAMDAWNVTRANVELQLDSGDCTRASGNGRNEVGFETYGEPTTEVGRAYTTTQGGVPIEGDVTLRLNWETHPACRISALVHEIGHILGLTHSEFGTDIMGYGPCAVLQPSEVEVDLLVERYGERTTQPIAATSVPDGSSVLTLTTKQVAYPAQDDAYYFNASVALQGGGAHALRPPECFTSAARSDEECTVESLLPDGFWPASARLAALGEVAQVLGQTTVVPASTFAHFARPLGLCNAVGCSEPFDVRAGDARVNGTGVDFGYLVYPLPGEGVSVQLANLSFYAPPHFIDIEARLEVRLHGVAGSAGLLGQCTLALGETCEVVGDFAGEDLDLVVVQATTSSRTGITVAGVTARAPGTPTEPATNLIAGGLPQRGFALAVWTGGPVSAAAGDPRIGAIWVSTDGVLRGYVVGAPAFVNQSFLANVGEELEAGRPVIVVVRG